MNLEWLGSGRGHFSRLPQIRQWPDHGVTPAEYLPGANDLPQERLMASGLTVRDFQRLRGGPYRNVSVSTDIVKTHAPPSPT